MIHSLSTLARLSTPLALVATLGLPTHGQQSVLVRQGLAAGDVLLGVDATGASTSLLDAVTFLPVELAGASRLERLVTSLPRPIDGPLPGVRLPTLGSLYRVQRPTGTGWLRVTPDGATDLLALTQDGTTPGQQGWVSVSPGGDRALVAATAAAGGGVTLLDLVDGSSQLLASGQSVLGESLRLGPGHAWWIADGELWVADLVTGGPAAAVSPPLGQDEALHPELVISQDGTTTAVISEAGPLRRRLHVVDAALGPTTVTPAPQALDAAGYASAVGPFLALSPDGSRLAWRADLPAEPGQTTKELFVQRVDLPAAAQQVTADGQFTDTIDIVGVFGFIGTQVFSFMAGEKPGLGDPPDSLGSADLFLVDTDTGVTQNVTASSGEPTAPYTTAGELEVLDVVLDSSGQRLLAVVDPDEGDFGVLELPTSGGAGWSVLVDQLLLAPQLVAAGDHTIVVLRAEPQPGAPTDGLYQLGSSGPLQLIAELPAGVALDRFVVSRDTPWAACAASAGAPFELPVVVDLASGTAHPILGELFALAPALAFTPDGRVALGLGLGAGGPYRFGALVAPGAGGVAWQVPPGPGFPLAP